MKKNREPGFAPDSRREQLEINNLQLVITGIRNWGLGIWILEFGFWDLDLGFGFWDLDLGFGFWDLEFLSPHGTVLLCRQANASSIVLLGY
jgi:hypothetical protein